MEQPTDLQLQLALAKELPELIGYHNYGLGRIEFGWLDSQKPITDKEWDWIANECWRQWFDSTGNNYMHFPYFSPSAKWQEVALCFFEKINKPIL